MSTSNGFLQIINESTTIRRNSSSCIDLIFTDQPSLVTNNGVHASVHSHCYHQSYTVLLICKKTDVSNIPKALQSVNWDRLLDNKNLDCQVLILNETILNIFRNFVPNNYVSCDDKDPVWMNESIKSKIKAKNKLYQVYVKKGRQETDFCAFGKSVRNLNDLILQIKTSYYKSLMIQHSSQKRIGPY